MKVYKESSFQFRQTW